MKGVVAATVAAILAFAPAAQAKPTVRFTRPTIVELVTGKRVQAYPRDRRLRFNTRYRITGVPARWTATSEIVITLTRKTDVLRIRTPRADAESGTWNWIVRGSNVRIPGRYPAGRYDVELRILVRHGKQVVARKTQRWRATVR